MHARRFGLIRVRSPLLAESLLFSVPAGTEMVHFPALSSSTYVFSRGYLGISQGGFPHSEISGSTPVCGSPKLIAAYHVLHRLLAPRHPPYALSSLTFTLGTDAVSAWRRANPDTKDLVQQFHRHFVCCGRKKLPFAGYSIVKEQMGTSSPNPSRQLRGDPSAPLRGRGARMCAPWLPRLPARSPDS